MSDTIPTFEVGERVRIMGTREMEKVGLANKCGEIARFDGTLALIMLDDANSVKIETYSLSHE